MTRRTTSALALLTAATVLQACTLSTSITRSARRAVSVVSESVNSASDAIGVQTARNARLDREYREDMRVAARDLTLGGATPAGFLRELGRVSELHGISDWESEPGALIALGAGVCDAGEPDPGALLSELGCDAEQRALALQGCRADEL